MKHQSDQSTCPATDCPDDLTSATVADLIITGAQIFTMQESQPWASAIAIARDRIVFVGNDDDAQRYLGKTTRHIQMSSELILPAFIDSHTHPVTSTQTGPILELPETQDPKVIAQAVSDYALAHPNLPLIKGRSWDITAFGADGPRKEILDAAAPNQAVLLLDSSGHSQWVNSKTLQMMGVDETTPDPVPGVSGFTRDPDGSPTGWVKEAALSFFMERLDIPTKLDGESLLSFLHYLRGLGVTSVYDAGIELLDVSIKNDEAYSLLARYDREGRLPVRYFGSMVIHSPEHLPNAINNYKRLRSLYDGDRLKFNSVKLFLDGVSELGTAYLLEPYENRAGSRGRPTISRDALDTLLAELQAEQIDLHVHTIGDGAVRMMLDAVEALQNRVGPLSFLVTIAHAELVDPADMTRFAQLGICVNHTPHWNGGYFSGQGATLGPERSIRTNQLATLIATGATVALSSDITESTEWETERANPYLGIQVGHTRQEPGAEPGTPVFPPQNECATLVDMLAGYSINGAIQLRSEHDLGSIGVGKLADFQILDSNIFEIPKTEIHKIRPIAVFMDGILVEGDINKDQLNNQFGEA